MDIETYLNDPLPFEEELNKYFKPTDNLTIFEIGACEGEDTIKLRRRYSNAVIHAFEPLPKNVARMKKNYKRFDASDIEVHQVALSNKDGSAEFYVSSGHPDNLPKTKSWDYGNKSSSLLPPKEHKKIHRWVKFDKKISVKTQRLDSFCKKHSISKIDFAFIDVQGAELMVLEGAGDLLKNIGMIWMEVEAIELYDSQPLKKEVEDFMIKQGFNCIQDTVGGIAGDQLYINKGLLRNNSSRNRFWNNLIRLAIFKRDKDLDIDIGGGLKMTVPPDMSWAFDKQGYYERNVLHWLKKLAANNDDVVFYDIGANYGLYSLILSPLSRACFAFEPVSSTKKVLDKNINRNHLNNVETFKVAISDQSRLGSINIYSSSGNNSIYDRNLPADHPTKFIKREQVKFEPLDSFLKIHNLAPPKIMKVDVEGGELAVLQGARNSIKKYMPVILMEYSEATSRDAGYHRTDLLKLLEEFGYKVYGISANVDDTRLYSPRSRQATIDNLIAAPKEIQLDTYNDYC